MRIYLPIIAALALSACGSENLSTVEDYKNSAVWKAMKQDWNLERKANKFFHDAWGKPGPHEMVINSEKHGSIRLWYEAPYMRDDVAALCRKTGIQHISRDDKPFLFINCATVADDGEAILVSIGADNADNPFEGIIAK